MRRAGVFLYFSFAISFAIFNDNTDAINHSGNLVAIDHSKYFDKFIESFRQYVNCGAWIHPTMMMKGLFQDIQRQGCSIYCLKTELKILLTLLTKQLHHVVFSF